MRREARAFSPASVGNVGVGFDILGHVIEGPGDTVTVRRIEEPVVRIAAIRGTTLDLPLEAPANTAGAALIAMREALELPFGFEVEIDKGIALGSGMGGSAASCVAAVIAANALLDEPLSPQALYPLTLVGEVFCPHTATAVKVLEDLRNQGVGGDWAVAATAHPAKFESVVEPLVGPVGVPPALADLLLRPAHAEPIGPDYQALAGHVLAGA